MPPIVLYSLTYAVVRLLLEVLIVRGRPNAKLCWRTIDERFVDAIAAGGVDPFAENVEYHSFAFQGPVFAQLLG